MHQKSFRKERFHVVTMVSNPVRYASRYRLYHKFAKHMHEHGVNLWTIELQLGDRPFAITNHCNHHHIQLRHWDELWHKENALNLAIQRLPHDWETCAWIDADIEFLRKDWVEETLHQLQVYKIVQMWETAIDLGPCGEAMSLHHSFLSQYIKKGAYFPENGYNEWHPGYAWSARREAIDDIGGLYDRSILGAGDRAMALAFVGAAQHSFHPNSHSAYRDSIMHYQRHCEHSLKRDVGYVSGTILHEWHGKKKDRRYWDRWQILVKNHFQPHHDLKPNSFGVLQLHDDHSRRFQRLRDEIRAYMRQRNEDSIDL